MKGWPFMFGGLGSNWAVWPNNLLMINFDTIYLAKRVKFLNLNKVHLNKRVTWHDTFNMLTRPDPTLILI